MNIILFGDSLFGRFSKPLTTVIESKIPGVIITNCATGGFDTRDGLARAELIAHLPADLFLLSFGMNDSAPWKLVPIDEFERNYTKIIRTLSSKRVSCVIPGPIMERKQPNPAQ